MIRIVSAILLASLRLAAEVESPLMLTMKRAVEIALAPDSAARLLLARESAVQARGRSAQAKSALLPQIETSAGVQDLTRNLAVLGLTTSTLGFPIPARVGPLSVVDARTSLTQTVFDASSIYRYRAAKLDALASESDVQNTEEQIAADVAHGYVEVLRAQLRERGRATDLQLAEQVLEQTENNRQAGTATGMEVARASLSVAEKKQLLLEAASERRRSELVLRRVLGVPLDTPMRLTDELARPVPDETNQSILRGALESRPDLKAQQTRERQMEMASRAARAQSLPSVQVFGDFGATGSSPTNAIGTYTAGLTIQFPVFDGGQRRAGKEIAASQWRQEQARTSDLRQQIQLEIDVAGDELKLANESIRLSETALETAQQAFDQAQRRFRNGAADHLLIAQTQAELAHARESRTEALYAANVAWIDLQKAAGRLKRELQVR